MNQRKMTMVKFRWHRGSLEDSLKTQMEFDTKEDMQRHIAREMSSWTGKKPEKFLFDYEYVGYDARCHWFTSYVCVDGNCVGMAQLEPCDR